MSKNPINLTVRFLLELGALAAYAVWGWNTGQGWLRYVLAIGVPVVMAACWGIFRIPNDPGPAPVPVPGWGRLLLELVFFGGACLALFKIEAQPYAWIFTSLIIIHYLISLDRIAWMLNPSIQVGK